MVESRENPILLIENTTWVLKTLQVCWNAWLNALLIASVKARVSLLIASVKARVSFWRPSKQHWWYYFKWVLNDDVSWKSLVTKLSEVVLDFVTKIRSRNISFLPCNVMHGKETSTHEMRNCWTGDGIKISGWSNLRVRSRKRRTKKISKLRKLLLPFKHYERDDCSPTATLTTVGLPYNTQPLLFLPRPVIIRVSQRSARRCERFSLNSAFYLVIVCAGRKYLNL
jgi:hypothetical protein